MDDRIEYITKEPEYGSWNDYQDNLRKEELRKFFVLVLTGILVLCYGTGMFWFGRVTTPKPDPQVYVVHDDATKTTIH